MLEFFKNAIVTHSLVGFGAAIASSWATLKIKAASLEAKIRTEIGLYEKKL